MSNLQRIRKEKGLTQKQLAEMVGIPIQTLQKYEQKVKNINNANVCTVINLARALGVDTRDILEKE